MNATCAPRPALVDIDVIVSAVVQGMSHEIRVWFHIARTKIL